MPATPGPILVRVRDPQAAGSSRAKARDAVIGTGIALDSIRFRYRIDGDAPPLFIAGADGKPALVSYRVKGSTYIVDRLVAAAELRHGEDPQRIVWITRRDAQWREVWK